jgi:acetoin utilization deacetylase AcuC-like enzyme
MAPRAPLPTGFVYDPVFLEHKTGTGFPERPERLTAIVKRLKEKGLLAKLVELKPAADPLEWIAAVHAPAYIERVKKASAACGDAIDHLDTGDCPISARTYDAAVAAAGGALAAADAVMEGRVRNAFCAVRPPGHHALRDRAMGFCFFGNAAIAARYLQKKHGVARVLIADWDVHHGNGTQAAFYEDPAVFYFSAHRSPFYPGSGDASERGAGKGEGTTLNVPLPAGAGDAEIRKAFEEKLKPAALAFKPDFVLVSAGFDAHRDDPLGGLSVTAEGYAALTRIVREIAETCCGGRLVSFLEGGYNLEALADSVEAHVRVLMETSADGRR